MSDSDFHVTSYQLHQSEWNEYTLDEKKIEQAKTWHRDDTVDAWRHLRMYSAIDPLLASFPDAYWLTVGDGRYGTDAHYLEKEGVRVLATDISDALLIKAKEEGFIKNYQRENAELMSFKNNTFDFVLCKEAYHHFPRPTIALYEMIRVAKKGVILIEPQDKITPSVRINLIEKIKFITNKFLKKNIDSPTIYPDKFEEVGNYIYTISEREIQKIALGIGLPLVAFKPLNDCYIPGVEYEIANAKSRLFQKVKYTIWYKDLLSKLKLKISEGLAAIIFKEMPDSRVINELLKQGYHFTKLPSNPYAYKYPRENYTPLSLDLTVND